MLNDVCGWQHLVIFPKHGQGIGIQNSCFSFTSTGATINAQVLDVQLGSMWREPPTI
jgi:hypothetical protein